jgi:prepilin-type N-terminal cleavage/methylation domain-containing protein
MVRLFPDRGFTLLELMTALLVAGVLLGVATWSMQGFIVGNRVNAAARELAARARSAAAIAARANTPVELRFVASGEAGCLPRYEIRAGATNYDTVCIATEYPGVELRTGGPDVSCADEPALPNCSLCAGTKTVTFYPSGEVTTSEATGSGDSIVFGVRGDNSDARTLAVGIRNVSGFTRFYRRTGTAWECP